MRCYLLTPGTMCLLAVSLLRPAPLRAQIQVGTIQGSVSDQTRAVLDGVRLTLESAISGYRETTLSTAEGRFVFNNVPFNTYRLRAGRAGFQTFTQSLSVRSNVPIQLAIVLKISPMNEAVTVESGAELVERDSASMRVTLDQRSIEKQPGAAPSRAMQSLITDLAGWMSEDSGLLHVRGADDEVLYMLDGMPLIDRIDPRFSSPLSPEMIRSMEVITGNIPAEYGDRLGAVVALQPKSGIDRPLFGSLGVAAGNFTTGEVSLEAGGNFNRELGFYAASSTSQSHRFLDPVDRRNFNNIGGTAQLNVRIDWHPTDRDILLFHIWNGGSNFRVPNDDEQERKLNRQRVRLRNDSQWANWQHLWSSATVTNLGLYHHAFSSRLLSTPRDNPFLVDQDRSHRREGLIANLSHQRHSHNIKFGMQGNRATPHEFFSYAVTDDDDAESLGFTDFARSFVPGNPFVFGDHKTFGQVSSYLQDSFSPFRNLTLSGGVRYDYAHQLFSSQQWSPRIGGVYYIPKTKTALRASFNRLFNPPPVENHLVSASPQARLLSPLAPQGGGYTPVKPESVFAYEIGFSQDLRGWFKLDSNAYWRRFRNFDDPNVFFATTIIFPNSVARGAAHGVDVRLDAPERHGWSGYLSYVNQNIYQVGPINGGLFLTTDLLRFGPGVRFVPDHDQRNSGSFAVMYHHHRSGVWAAFSGHYQSGTPLELEANKMPRIRQQLGRQGVSLEDVIDPNSQRVKPRALFDFSAGVDLFRKERVGVSAQLDMQNLTNGLFLYNFGNPFSGTHFGYPRLYSGRLKFTFH